MQRRVPGVLVLRKHRLKVSFMFFFLILTITVLYIQSMRCSIKEHPRLFQNITFTNSSEVDKLLQYDYMVLSSKRERDDIPVFVTAASSNHFRESIELIENINRHLRPRCSDIKLIYFDIGLMHNETNILKGYHNLDLRRFPFSLFPSHVKNLKTYAWKPITISLILKEFDYVMWIDTSVRFDIDLPIENLFEKARVTGLQTLNGEGSIAERTSSDTMLFLRLDPSDFYNIPELQTGWIILSRTQVVTKYILRPWLLCALTENCIYPDSAKHLPHECLKTNQTEPLGYCHRPEQSIFGIILSTIFADRRHCIAFDVREYGSLRRADER